MAWNKLQSLAGTAGGSPVTKAITAAAVNNLFVVTAGTGSNTSGNPTISDTQGNTWNAVFVTPPSIAGGGKLQQWWCLAKNTLATTITCSATSPAGFMNILVDEFSGNLQSGTVLDNQNSATGSGTPTGALVPASDNCLFYASCNDTVTGVGSGFTKGADDASGDWSEFKALGAGTSGVSQTATFAGSGTYVLTMATYKAAAGGGGGATNQTPQPADFNGGLGDPFNGGFYS